MSDLEWIQSIQRALNYIEVHLLDKQLDNETVAKQAYSSNANFQRIFSIVTGVTVADYIRCRRLTLAGEELADSEMKVIDTALKYGYDTPESFSKAFIRFHGIAPSEARAHPGGLKNFAPIFLRIEVDGGLHMNAKMIANIPQVANSWIGENYYFNAMARHVMGCLGEMKLTDYSLFAGVTGDCFVQFYRFNGIHSTYGIHGVGACDYYLGLHGLVNVFEEVGYAAEAFSERELQSDREHLLQKITDSIDKGVPVVWYRPGMAGIVVGYENDGNTLLYLTAEIKQPVRLVLDEHFFKNKPSMSVYDKNNIDTYGWIIVGRKKHEVVLKQIYRDAIIRLPKLLNMKTDEYVFGAQAFRAWANDIENGAYDSMRPEDYSENFFAYEVYVLNLSTNSGGCQEFLEKAQELNPDLTFLDDVRRQYRITNYLWNGGYWVKDVHSSQEREKLAALYGDDNLEKLGGGFGCKLETLQDKKRRAPIVQQIRRLAECMDEIVRILNENAAFF